ncbi:hypothetical protein B9G54_00225 [Alloscardovia macacae]|uniref:Colicin transporter n=1 Tax=Alloscardovia macacae TaxID=1160091 RepID=A0A1Y2T2H6_9BIFI|nr:hypothetical protein B9G54_00225 [Alloscardovia macacae]OTA30184.1 hypothetical protein B9T39_00305 [Alloscardovia macacae]
MSACVSANSGYESAVVAWQASVKQAESVSGKVTSADSVADVSVFTDFSKARSVKVAEQKALNCGLSLVSMWGFDPSSRQAETERIRTATSALKTAIGRVEKSYEVKQVEVARAQAQQVLDTASQVYQSTDGQVADNATRDQLKTLIDGLQTTLNDKQATVESLHKASEPIQSASDTVNQSVEAKRVADQQAKEQAEQQARAQQAQANAQRAQRNTTRNNRGTNNGTRANNTPRNSGGGAGSARANTGTNTPTPANNGGNTSSSSGDIDWIAIGRQREAEHRARGEFCPPTVCFAG